MSSFLMGYPHPHFQGPIGGVGPAIEPKFPPTEDFLSPYHHHHHHHMHLNHHHHPSVSPLHNGYASNGTGASSGNVGNNPMTGNIQSPMDYYGNGGNYSYPASSNNYYNQQAPTHLPPCPPPTNLSPLNSSSNSNSNNNNPQQTANLDAYANNGNITEMASVPATQGSAVSGAGGGSQTGLNHSTMHPYSAATAAVTNPGLSSANTGGGGNNGLLGSYYSGYYGGTAPHHNSVLDLPLQCPHVEPTNTALGLQELGN